MLVDIARIRLDSTAQPRAKLNSTVIAEMRDDIKAGDKMPAIVVFRDGDGEYWLADGWHRVTAFRQEGRPLIEADVRTGTARDAYLEALALNKTGNALSIDERRSAVRRMLADPEWSKWSAREIGRRVGIDHEVVSKLKSELSGGNRQMQQPKVTKEKTVTEPDKEEVTVPRSEPKKVKYQRNGKECEMDISGIADRQRARKGAPPRLSTKAWEMLKRTPVADDQKQKRLLAAQPRALQVAMARLIKDGEVATVSEAKDAIMRGAPTDKWARAYAAVYELDLDDRVRLCRLVLSESDRPLHAVK